MTKLILAIMAFILFIAGRFLAKWVDREIGNGSPSGTTPPGYMRSREQAEREALLWQVYSERLPRLKKLKSLAFWIQIAAGVPALVVALLQFFCFPVIGQ